MTDEAGVSAADAQDPLILALDIGSSSTRALVYDRQGLLVRDWQAHERYELSTVAGGGVEASAETLVSLTIRCIDAVMRDLKDARREITAVACDSFWHSLMGVDGRGDVRTPVYTWADTRSAAAADRLKESLDAAAVHARTGATIHASYWPAKLLWLHETDSALDERIAHWMSIGEYLYLELFGDLRVSVSMASGTGLLDEATCEWDEELLEALPLRRDQLSPLGDLQDPLTGLRDEYAKRWPGLAQIPWYLPLGDGACNNVGSGGWNPERVVLMVGTSGAIRVVRETDHVEVPEGLWTYRVDRKRIVQGGALSSGGNVFAWLNESLQLPDLPSLEGDIAGMQPDGHGLTILPFLAGERSPHWNDEARAAVTGLSLHTTSIDQARAWLEAVAYRFGLVYRQLRAELPASRCIIGSGSGLIHSPAWMQIMSDVLEETLIASAVPEATSRGAALLALQTMGTIGSLDDVSTPLGKHFAPQSQYSAVYRAAVERQEELYRRLLG